MFIQFRIAKNVCYHHAFVQLSSYNKNSNINDFAKTKCNWEINVLLSLPENGSAKTLNTWLSQIFKVQRTWNYSSVFFFRKKNRDEFRICRKRRYWIHLLFFLEFILLFVYLNYTSTCFILLLMLRLLRKQPV